MKLPMSSSSKSSQSHVNRPSQLTNNLFISLLSNPIRLQGTFQLISATRKKEGVYSTRISDGFFKVKAMFTGKAAAQLDLGSAHFIPNCILSGMLRYHSEGVVIVKQTLKGWPCLAIVGDPKDWRWKKENQNLKGSNLINWEQHQLKLKDLLHLNQHNVKHQFQDSTQIPSNKFQEKTKLESFQTQSLLLHRSSTSSMQFPHLNANSLQSAQMSHKKLKIHNSNRKQQISSSDQQQSNESILAFIQQKYIKPICATQSLNSNKNIKLQSEQTANQEDNFDFMIGLIEKRQEKEKEAIEPKSQEKVSTELLTDQRLKQVLQSVLQSSRQTQQNNQKQTNQIKDDKQFNFMKKETMIQSEKNEKINNKSVIQEFLEQQQVQNQQLPVYIVPFECLYFGIPFSDIESIPTQKRNYPSICIFIKAIGNVFFHQIKSKGMVARCIVGDLNGQYIMDAVFHAFNIELIESNTRIILQDIDQNRLYVQEGQSYIITDYQIKQIFSAENKVKGSAFQLYLNMNEITMKPNSKFRKINYYAFQENYGEIHENQSFFCEINKLQNYQIGSLINLHAIIISVKINSLKSKKVIRYYEVTQPGHWQVIQIVQFLDQNTEAPLDAADIKQGSLLTAFNLKITSYRNVLGLSLSATSIIKIGYFPLLHSRTLYHQYSSSSIKLQSVKLNYPSFTSISSLSGLSSSNLSQFYFTDLTILSLKIGNYNACQICSHKNESGFCSNCRKNTTRVQRRFMISTVSDISTTAQIVWNEDAINEHFGQLNQTQIKERWILTRVQVWLKRNIKKDGKDCLNGVRVRQIENIQKSKQLINLLKTYL